MPSTTLKHFAKKTGRSLKTAEHDWEKAKSIVRKEYGYSEDDPRFWALTTGITKRMLGMKESISFKQFLEAAQGEEPTYDERSLEEAYDLIRKNCSDSLWMLHGEHALYRGDRGLPYSGLVYLVNPTATKRKSQNTSNYYTEIFDNHPAMADFPKRSRSFVASTNLRYARGFARRSLDNDVVVLVPFNGTKIGISPEDDLWGVYIQMFGERRSLDFANEWFRHLEIDETWDSILQLDKQLKDEHPVQVKRFYHAFEKANKENKDHLRFLEELIEAYSPSKTRLTWVNTENLKSKIQQLTDNEVWIGGPCVAIYVPAWKQLKREFRS